MKFIASRAMLTPSMHKKLLIGSDCLFFELCTGRRMPHEPCKVGSCVLGVEDLLAPRIEASEFTQVVAGDCLHRVQRLRRCVSHIKRISLKYLHKIVDMLDVLSIIEINEVCLPELFGVNGRPAEVLASYLCAPFVERSEFLVVLVKVVTEVL